MAATSFNDQPNPQQNNEGKEKKKFNDDEIKRLILLKKKWPREKLLIENGKTGQLTSREKSHLSFQKWRYDKGDLTEFFKEKK